MIFGLIAGVFFREFPKMVDAAQYVEESQLSIIHVHTLTLGMLFFFFVLIFARLFNIHEHKWFNKFFLTYHIGLFITLVIMLVHGIWVSVGNEPHPALLGMAGIGHIVVTAGFGMFFKILLDQLNLLDKKAV